MVWPLFLYPLTPFVIPIIHPYQIDTTMDEFFLSAQHIVKRFANHTALNDVSIDVPRGKIFGLLGPNGAGKTTLIRIINRITAPDSGEVIFDGHPFSADDVARIGYLPEERGLYKKMKVGEQAVYLAMLKGLSARKPQNACTTGLSVWTSWPGGTKNWKNSRRVCSRRCSLSSPCSISRNS